MRADVFDPGAEFVFAHEIENPVGFDFGEKSSGRGELHKSQLCRTVGICAQRNAAARSPGNSQKIHAQILTIWIAIDFDGLIQFRGQAEDPVPIGLQTLTKIVNTTARMSQYLNVGIPERGQVTFGLIFRLAQRGVKTSQDDIQLPQAGALQVASSLGIEIQFNRAQEKGILSVAAGMRIESANFLRLLPQLGLINSSGNLQSFGVIGDCNVFISSQGGSSRHFQRGAGSIAPQSVHLQVASDLFQPIRPLIEDPAGFGNAKKSRANRRNVGDWRRIIDPAAEQRCNEGSDARELGERAAFSDKLFGFDFPKKCLPCRSPESSLCWIFCAFCFFRKQFSNGGIFEHRPAASRLEFGGPAVLGYREAGC